MLIDMCFAGFLICVGYAMTRLVDSFVDSFFTKN